MSKSMNAAIVEAVFGDLEGCDSCVLIGCEGWTSSETVTVRAKLREKGFRMRVVKNTLAGVAFDRRNMKGLGGRLSGPSAVVFGGEGAIAIAKHLVEEAKTNKKLKIHGGYSEGEVLDGAGITALSKVPGRVELLGMTLSGMFGAVSGMSANLDGPLTEMHGLLEALVKQKEAAGSGG